MEIYYCDHEARKEKKNFDLLSQGGHTTKYISVCKAHMKKKEKKEKKTQTKIS